MSRFKVKPFIRSFSIDTSEFLEGVDSFACFNDFFTRKLNLQCRPMVAGKRVMAMPADARYLVVPRLDRAESFWVKGKEFSVQTLLHSASLAKRYGQGAMAIARLCPVDYHRFHFPCDCLAGSPEPIAGPLYSVNPIALKRNGQILSENKRIVTQLHTEAFGTVLYIEVGATYVGSIHQTFTPGQDYRKGDEKGYFSFGGSCLILLFEPDKIVFDQDLIEFSSKKIEVRGLLGDSLGSAK